MIPSLRIEVEAQDIANNKRPKVIMVENELYLSLARIDIPAFEFVDWLFYLAIFMFTGNKISNNL
jgi:hypothetical protein